MSRSKTAPWTVELQDQEGTREIIARCWREDAAEAAVDRVDLEDGETLTLRRRRRILRIRGHAVALAEHPDIPF